MRHILALLLSLFALHAQAGQRFSFSGLSWGDSPEQVERKLTASGHSAPIASSAGWAPKGGERREFAGAIGEARFDGAAIFQGGRLNQVLLSFKVRNGDPQNADVPRLFVARYGTPRQEGAPGYDQVWTSDSGEQLRLSSSIRGGTGSYVATYASPQAMRSHHEMASRERKEVRQAKQLREQELRRNAAGL